MSERTDEVGGRASLREALDELKGRHDSSVDELHKRAQEAIQLATKAVGVAVVMAEEAGAQEARAERLAEVLRNNPRCPGCNGSGKGIWSTCIECDGVGLSEEARAALTAERGSDG